MDRCCCCCRALSVSSGALRVGIDVALTKERAGVLGKEVGITDMISTVGRQSLY